MRRSVTTAFLREKREPPLTAQEVPRDKGVRLPAIFGLITRLEGGSEIARTDALDQFVPDETLEELIASIERDIAADKPAAALDRLHTYCAKKFGHLLDARSIEWKRDEPCVQG
jgi:hypothetical protein